MRTKIVYVLTSSSKDYYLEQTLLSILSLKEYNDDARIILITDAKTNNSLMGERKRILDFCTEHIVVETPKDFTQVESSRFIKTSLREIVSGDYLFIDGDTAISDNLSEIDNCNEIIAAVPDKHLSIKSHQWKSLIDNWATKVGWEITDNDIHYFNSGVFFVKDLPEAHNLYKLWHEYWLESRAKGLAIDQPSLGKANAAAGYPIKEISGEWNCQILENGLKFLADAKIIHYFASTFNKVVTNCPYLYKDQTIYEYMRNHNMIVPDWFKMHIKYPKSAFSDKISFLSGVDVDLITTPLYLKLRELYTEKPKVFKSLDSIRKYTGKLLHSLKFF